MLGLLGLRNMLQVDEGVVEFFAVSEYFSTSKRLNASALELVGGCGASLRARTIVAHDGR